MRRKSSASRRAYRLGRRKVSSDQTRNRIVEATRELLSTSEFGEFTVDAVAERSGVSRMTVYYQFRSKGGLLEALFNSLASHRFASQLVDAMQHPDPLAGLQDFVQAIGGFWESDRTIIARLQGLAALDPDFEVIWRQREGLRRQGLSVLASRVSKKLGQPTAKRLGEVVDTLYALVSFETFNAMAGDHRSFAEVTPLVADLARASFDLPSMQRVLQRTPRSHTKTGSRKKSTPNRR